MCESLGIAIKTTLVEKHNLILANMLDLELAVVWCVSAKNSLSNIHSFSPYQLAISTNPKLSSMMRNRAPALAATPSSKIICNNLKAMHKVREAFIVSHYRQMRIAWSSQSIRPRWATSSCQKWKHLRQNPPLLTSVDTALTSSHSWNQNHHRNS